MRINNIDTGLKYITFDNIEGTGFVRHAFSTRLGGVSKKPYDSMNLGMRRGDERESVLENYRRLASAVGFDYTCVVSSNQIHHINIHRARSEDRGSGTVRQSNIKDVDAFVTNEMGIVLQTFHADCVPVFLADIYNKAIGLVHAGWMGTLKGVTKATIERMIEEFGTEPQNIVAAIGPSIGPYSFETDDDVADKFRGEFGEFIAERGGKYLIDLWGINRRVMEGLGVRPTNIEESYLCTYKHPELFFSHRKMGEDRGTMSAFMEIVG